MRACRASEQFGGQTTVRGAMPPPGARDGREFTNCSGERRVAAMVPSGAWRTITVTAGERVAAAAAGPASREDERDRA